ncbi:nucleolar complex protein 3 [Holotrichia oblita]|uniref:Nucleolar complex protein 3 n=1 Tax=Holotrichia oblita TaxID=644536 RepID=A0ACB9TMD0_HOLOL|nr:nucleolar complex protein 3 [Holotrichia oblita]
MYKTEESDSSDYGEDMLEMVDQHDLEFLKDAIKNKSYSILKRVKHIKGSTTAKKRKVEKDDSFDTLENVYANQLEEPQHVKYLLPIKTKEGVIARSFVANNEIESTESTISNEKLTSNDDDEYVLDYDDSIVPQSMAGLLAHYSHLLRNKKEELKLGEVALHAMCDLLVTHPYFNFSVNIVQAVIPLLNHKKASVRQTISLACKTVFREDKKEEITLKASAEESDGKWSEVVKRKKKFKKINVVVGINKANTDIIGVAKFCHLRVYRLAPDMQANQLSEYLKSKNITDITCEPMTNSKSTKPLCKKKAHNVRPDVLELLLHLKIKDVNIDQQKENEIKQKTIKSHKHNVLKMSKKEKKRKKRLQELEKEMLETKAEENIQTKQKNLTEITKIIFGIYFRILKSSNNTRVLGVCLEGLAKYSHCINLEYYVDLLNMLNALLTEEWLGYREQIHCVQTVFTILHDQGDSINLDPTRFYTSLYSNLLHTHASTTHGDCHLVLKTLSDVLVKRRKKITNKRTIGFVKRMSTLSLQLLHNGSLGMLGLIKQILIQNRSLDILLDLDSSLGDGDYHAEVNDPEYSNASSTGLYELTLLQKYYHPVVSKFAKHIVNGAPATGEGSLPIQFSKRYGNVLYMLLYKYLPEQLFTDFDMSEMAFNPPVQIPKKILPRPRRKSTRFVDSNFKRYCNAFVKKSKYSLFS